MATAPRLGAHARRAQDITVRPPDRQRLPAGQCPARRVFTGTSDQVRKARAFTESVLGPVPVLDDAVLLVTELCANAIQHTASGRRGGRFEVVLTAQARTVRAEVRDQGADTEPGIGPADPGTAGGRGLRLVAQLSESWGFDGGRDGRTVFFRMRW
jgi:anti-sigma regulatory factor (Ser/Thr protein kinase)